jgi:hypothetical protein
MKTLTLVVVLVGAVLFSSLTAPLLAQDKPASAWKWEYAVLKWDAPDRIYYNLPDSFKLVYLSKVGATMPKEAQREEWCLNYAANQMAAEGWEAVNISSRRILMKRAKVN